MFHIIISLQVIAAYGVIVVWSFIQYYSAVCNVLIKGRMKVRKEGSKDERK